MSGKVIVVIDRGFVQEVVGTGDLVGREVEIVDFQRTEPGALAAMRRDDGSEVVASWRTERIGRATVATPSADGADAVSEARSRAERHINALFGIPNPHCDTDEARELLLETVMELGLSALSDEGVRRLAAKHLAADESDRFRRPGHR